MLRALVAALLLALCAPCAAFATVPGYDPDTPPPGANDFGCRPSAAHPDPVVLVHGLGANAQANWYWMAPRIAARGYCVFALTYGRTTSNPTPFDYNGGTARMEDSEHELAAFVDRVLAVTGAQQVDIVGHSEGSLMPDYYLRFDPDARWSAGPSAGRPKVARYVGMTPLWQGTDPGGLATLSNLGAPTGGPGAIKSQIAAHGCASCSEFLAGSDFIAALSSGDGARVPDVTYTMLMTTHDELVVPYTSGIMAGATNIVMQDQCPADPSEHLALATNPNALLDVLNALDPAHPQLPVDCTTLARFS
jgi:pimeloyl-ACP methyl ester carboxylesterase